MTESKRVLEDELQSLIQELGRIEKLIHFIVSKYPDRPLTDMDWAIIDLIKEDIRRASNKMAGIAYWLVQIEKMENEEDARK